MVTTGAEGLDFLLTRQPFAQFMLSGIARSAIASRGSVSEYGAFRARLLVGEGVCLANISTPPARELPVLVKLRHEKTSHEC